MRFRLLSPWFLVAVPLVMNARADLPEVLQELFAAAPSGLSSEEVMDARIKSGEPVPSDQDVIDVWVAEGKKLKDWTPLIRQEDESAPSKSGLREPVPAQRQILLDTISKHPELIPDLVKFLPKTEQAALTVDSLFHFLPDATDQDKARQRSVRAWMYLYGGLHHAEVVADAWHLEWQRYGTVEGARRDPTLHALQVRDAQDFRSVLEILSAHGADGVGVVAARLMLEQAKPGEGARWRDQLKWSAIDPSLAPEVRRIAVEALIACYWPERDEWILSTLDLADCGEISCYEELILNAKDHWLPALTGRLNNHGQSARDHASALLLSMNEAKEDPECLKPLLPWLEDAGWSKLPESFRVQFVLALGEVTLPESVPGLQHLLDEPASEDLLSATCDALGAQQVTAALPALREAALRCQDFWNRQRVIGGIDDLKGYPPEEVVKAVEAFFSGPEIDKSKASSDLNLDVGYYFAQSDSLPVKARERLQARAHDLVQDNPGLSGKLKELAERKPAPTAPEFAKALENQSATSADIREACENRLDGTWPAEAFLPLAAKPGVAGGIASALSGDGKKIEATLSSGDIPKQEGLLAAMAVMVRPLPLDEVLKLANSSDPDLAQTASFFLYHSEDLSIWMAWRRLNSFWPGKDAELFTNVRKEVRQRSGRSDEPQEILGLERANGWHSEENIFLAVYPDLCLAFRQDRGGRLATAPVSPGKLQEIHDYISRYRVEELPLLTGSVDDGTINLYYRLTPDGGVAFLPIPEEPYPMPALDLYTGLVELLRKPVEKQAWQVSYGPGSEILILGSKLVSLWKAGAELLGLVEHGGEELPMHVDLEKKDAFPTADSLNIWDLKPLGDEVDVGYAYSPRLRMTRSGAGFVRTAMEGGNKGVWLQSPGHKLESIVTGPYDVKRTSPDGRWAFATTGESEKPLHLVRIDVRDKQVVPIAGFPDGNNFLFFYSAALGKFLVSGRFKDDAVEYYLVDPSAATAERLKPEEHPGLSRQAFSEHGRRPLQPVADSPDEFWSVEGNESGTAIMRINARTLTAKKVWEIPGEEFEFDAMWVDEKSESLDVCIGGVGDLVRFDLKGMRVPAKQ